jgi:hypothetical protein
MRLGRALFWLWCCGAALLLLSVKIVVICALLGAIAPLLFVLAAQSYRWGQTGEWPSVPVNDLLKILGIEAAPGGQPIVDFLLGLPATLTLFLAALVLLWVVRLLNRLEQRQRQQYRGGRQKYLVRDIEQALADR